MIDKNAPALAQIERMGWPWHGRIESKVGQTNFTRLVMADRTVYAGDPIGATADDGVWRLEPYSTDTYLWAPGLPDQDDPSIEAEGGKWWGKAILRNGARFAYGDLRVATPASGHNGAWPVWLDGKKGQVSVLVRPGFGEARICEDDTVGDGDPIAYTVPIADIDLQQDGIYVYVSGNLCDRIGFGLWDITPDGRSALFVIAASSSAVGVTGSIVTGLLRLDVVGEAGNYSVVQTLLHGRAGACGSLSLAEDGGLTLNGLVSDPIKETQSGGTPPACAQIIKQAEGKLVDAEGQTGSTYRGYDGSVTRTAKREGALFRAWFGPGGSVEEVRFDLEIVEAISNVRTDYSTGEYQQVTSFSYDGSQCVQTGVTETDTRRINIHGDLDYSLKYALRLYAPSGALVDTVSHEFRSHTECDYGIDTDFELVGTYLKQVYVNGSLLTEQTEAALPISAWGLPPAAATIFGSTPQVSAPVHDVNTEIPNTSAAAVAFFGQLGILEGSNNTVMLADLRQVDSGPYTMRAGAVLTPSGPVGLPVETPVSFAGSGTVGIRIGECISVAYASYNPVTQELARPWPDITIANWV